MLDRDIRPTLLRVVRASHPGASIFDEFPVCRKGRADLVAVNAALWGYEIKSDRDTLRRLPLQIERYECVFDYCIVVAAARHIEHAERIIPSHWGVISVHESRGECSLTECRVPQRNPNRRRDQIIRILWKSEGVKVLRAHGVNVPRNAPVRLVWKMLGKMSVHDIEESVRNALKCRNARESVLPQTPSDDLGTTATTP